MKRTTLSFIALASMAAFIAGPVFAQSKSNQPAPAAPVAAPGQKLIKVAHLPTAKDNQEFQQNVQLVQAQRQAAVELNASMEREKDAKKKAELKKQLDQLMAKLNENNQAMTKVYGFSLTRNYIIDVEASSIYLIVSDEEAKQIEKEQKAKTGKK